MSNKAYYRKHIIDLRLRISQAREAKKRDNERYARAIRGCSSPSTKASYRRQKIDAAERHKRHIEDLQRQVLSARQSMARCSR